MSPGEFKRIELQSLAVWGKVMGVVLKLFKN